MSDKPARAARPVKLNVINEPKDSYTGGPSSLCPGCGHDQISNVIINAAWENGIQPHRIAKMSGIGCSSKTPAYYLGQSHGFNTVHGRMPSVTTGAYAVNKDLLYIGVSGDGDSASIGIGQLIHAIRRNMDMVYIVENNGVYIDLSEEFTYGGGSASMIGRLGQVIYTASSLEPDVKVWIFVEGKPLEMLGSEGLEVSQPITRQNFQQEFQF